MGEFKKNLPLFFTDKAREVFLKEIAAISEGKKGFEAETKNKTLGGDIKDLYIKWMVVSGFEEDMSRVVGAAVDITELKKREKELTRNEGKYRILIENIYEGLWQIDENGYTAFVTPGMAEILGYKPEEMIGKHLFSFMDKKTIKTAKSFLERRKKGVREEHEFRFLNKDKKPVYVRIATSPLIDETGKYNGAIAYVSDMTREKKLRDALIKKEKRFSDFLNLLPEIVVETDKDFRITFVNETGLRITGYSKKDINKGLSIFTILDKKDHEKARKNIEKLIKNEHIIPNEYSIRKKDGKNIPVLTNSNTIFENNNFRGLRIVGVDITEKKKTEERIRESEKKYRELFESSLDGIYRTTLEGEYIDANPALIRMLGYRDAADLFSINVSTQLYADENDRPGPENRNRTFETRLKKKEGTIIWAEISSRVVYEGGKPKYYEGIVRDVTNRKKMEKQLIYQSFHDHLTGLYNRAYFEEEIYRIDYSRKIPVSFIMGDINSLKLVNDAFGHKKGDRILCKCANILKDCCRKDDIVARWGGDEFSIILPNTPEEVANKIIERIKQRCRKANRSTEPISLSLGCATKTKKESDIQKIIRHAEDNMYRNKLLERDSISGSIINSLEATLVEKSHETEKHAKRLQKMAKKMGKIIGLPAYKVAELLLLCTLHDIGKIAIPEKVLNKKAKLSPKEWEIIRRHPEIGYNIAKASPQISHIAKAILAHHEWWDGTGYPKGLKGEGIPENSRILAIIDAYDVMVHGRIYKEPLSKQAAIQELEKFSGIQFDPSLVNVFVEELLQKT